MKQTLDQIKNGKWSDESQIMAEMLKLRKNAISDAYK